MKIIVHFGRKREKHVWLFKDETELPFRKRLSRFSIGKDAFGTEQQYFPHVRSTPFSFVK